MSFLYGHFSYTYVKLIKVTSKHLTPIGLKVNLKLHYIKQLKEDFILRPIRLILSMSEDIFQIGCCVSDWFKNRTKDP